MVISLLPGVPAANAVEALRAEVTAAANMRTSGGSGFDRFNAYNEWAQEALGRLGSVLRPSEVDRLIATPRHWLLQGLDPSTRANTLGSLVDLEASQVAARLQEAF